MAHYAIGRYPWRPTVWRENNDRDFNRSYKYPHGTPASARTSVYTEDGTVLSVLTELAPLVRALVEISEKIYNYPLHTPTGGYTGAYANRVIAGSSTPSSHSRGTTIDVRASDNPQSWTFTSTWPPELVHIWTQCGFYWGGFYRGVRYDTMHMAYNDYKRNINKNLRKANKILKKHNKDKVSGGSEKKSEPKKSKYAEITADGVSVSNLQLTLNVLGHNLAIDGKIGSKTTAAVRKAQKALGVKVDLYVGPKTVAAINSQIKYVWPLDGSQVFGTWNHPGWAKRTRSGDPRWDGRAIRKWVKYIQWSLHLNHAAPGGRWIDGIYGPPTDNYVRKAQSAYGIAVDGLVGKTTFQHLFQL